MTASSRRSPAGKTTTLGDSFPHPKRTGAPFDPLFMPREIEEDRRDVFCWWDVPIGEWPSTLRHRWPARRNLGRGTGGFVSATTPMKTASWKGPHRSRAWYIYPRVPTTS